MKIIVIGVGGGGGNAVGHMLSSNIEGVDFVCVNTDVQALEQAGAKTLLQMGRKTTKGLGAGASPEVGRDSAIEDREKFQEILEGANMAFITAGMGGGTGTGGAPVVAEIAREMGILTVAVVTKPFAFEGRQRMRVAEKGIAELSKQVDSLITVPNEKLLGVMGPRVKFLEAFAKADDVLLGAVQAIADLITRPGIINVDFADVKTVMSEMGSTAMMGAGVGTGEARAREAAEKAIVSPLLDNTNLQGARGMLVNITANQSLELGEFNEIGETVSKIAADNATVVVGTVIDENMVDELRVTVVATGLDPDQKLAVESADRENLDIPTFLRRSAA